MAIFTPKRKTSSGTETVQFPISSINGLSTELNAKLSLSGGTMTGNLKWSGSTALPETTSPSYLVCIDAFAEGGTTKWASIANVKTALGVPSTYAGSASAGGSATSAVKLDTSAGSATQPVYFSGGKPVATTYTLGASVPSGAKFTDTDTGATNVAVSGSGNAVTTASYDASTRKLTLTKGTTFLTNVTATAGSNINSVGTPSVTASTSNGVTTLTFNYLKGATGATGNTGATGSQGIQGYGWVTSVSRTAFTEANWTTYGTVGHTENWSDTSSIRNNCRVGDIFTIVGTATDTGNAHVLFYRSTNASGNLAGTCIGHSIANRGAAGATGSTGVGIKSITITEA